MTFEPYGRRHWAVYDERGDLVCLCVYKKGAREVVRRLSKDQAPEGENALAERRQHDE